MTEVIRLDPQLALAHENRGLVYGKKDEYDKAIADLTEAIRLEPKRVSTYTIRGMVYFAKCEIDKSIADWTEAIRLDPHDAAAYIHRGVCYMHQRDDRRGDHGLFGGHSPRAGTRCRVLQSRPRLLATRVSKPKPQWISTQPRALDSTRNRWREIASGSSAAEPGRHRKGRPGRRRAKENRQKTYCAPFRCNV